MLYVKLLLWLCNTVFCLCLTHDHVYAINDFVLSTANMNSTSGIRGGATVDIDGIVCGATDCVQTSSSERSLTGNDLLYQIGKKQQKFRSSISAWRSRAVRIERLWLNPADTLTFKKECASLEVEMSAVSDTYNELYDLLPEDRKGCEHEKYESIVAENYQLQKRVTQYVRNFEGSQRSYRSSRSHHSSKSRSHSSKSHSSSASNSSKRADAAASAAARRAKLKYLDEEAKQKAEVAKQETELQKLQTLKEIDMAEAKAETFCKIEKEENSFEIEALPDDECNFVNKYIESCALSNPNELMTQTHVDKLPPSETIPPPCEEKSSPQNEPVAETLPSISASNIPASLASNAKLDPLADEFLPQSNTPIPTLSTPDVPVFRPDDTDPTCVYSAVIPSAAMTKTNATPYENSAGAPAHTSENSDQDSIGVSHMILSYESPTNQLSDVNSEKVQVCAQEVRSPTSEEISSIKLDISDKGNDFLYPEDDYKRPNITKQTISHQESNCHQIILLLLSIIMYTMLNCANLVSSVHKNHALVNSSLDSDMGLAHKMEPTFRHTYWLYQQWKSNTQVGEPPPINLLGFNIVGSSMNMDLMRQTLFRTWNTLSIS